jgi:hypothetical protein
VSKYSLLFLQGKLVFMTFQSLKEKSMLLRRDSCRSIL